MKLSSHDRVISNKVLVMVLEKLRKISNRIINPIAKKFQGSRVSPNIITIFGLIFMIAASACTAIVGYFSFSSLFLIITVAMLFCSGFMDLLDGGIAKVTGQKTKFGGVLDSTVDRYADAFFIFGLVFGNFLNPPTFLVNANLAFTWGVILGFLGLVGAYMTSYVRSRAEIEGVSMAGVGLIERGERLIIFFVGICFEVLFPGYYIMFYIFIVLAVLMHITALQRISHAYKVLKPIDEARQKQAQDEQNN
jgi:archaetidylinositol phosphate synthase